MHVGPLYFVVLLVQVEAAVDQDAKDFLDHLQRLPQSFGQDDPVGSEEKDGNGEAILSRTTCEDQNKHKKTKELQIK